MVAEPAGGLPRRPALRPGARATRRGDGLLQIGLPPGPTVTAPDVPEVHDLLAELQAGLPAGLVPGLSPAPQRLCQALLAADLLVDGSALLDDLARAGSPEEKRQAASAFAEHGPLAVGVRRRRAASYVEIGHEQAPELARRLTGLVTAAGLSVARPAATSAATSTAAPPHVALHVSVGEPDRDRLDAWMRADVAHLVVRCVEGRVGVGPFVLPGVTACLRCVDAHDGERDPRHPVVVRQYAGPPTRGAPPEPVPYDLAEVALVLAARDVAAWVDGRRPRTWSATVAVEPDLRLGEHRWARHPGCGCAWQQPFAG